MSQSNTAQPAAVQKDGSPPSVASDKTNNIDGSAAYNNDNVAAAAAQSNKDDDADPPFDGETFTLHEVDYEVLIKEGWSDNAIKQSVICGCFDDDTCRQWLRLHLNHPDLNKALSANVRVLIKAKVRLTPEQREAKVAELKAKIAAKKEKERQEQLTSEKDRIEDGHRAREAAEARKQYKREMEERERRAEKEADRKAREKITMELEIDRLVRTGKARPEAEKEVHATFEKRREEAKAKQEAEWRAQAEARNRPVGVDSSSSSTSSPAGEDSEAMKTKKPWNLAAIVPEAVGWRDDASRGGAGVAAAASSAQQQAMSLFAATAGFIPREMEDHTPFPDHIPAKRFNKTPSSAATKGSFVASDASDDTNAIYVPDFTDASPKEIFKTLLIEVKDQVITSGGDVAAVFSTLRRIVSAVRDQPSEPKVRCLKPTSNIFKTHLSSFPKTLFFLRAVGFQKHTEPTKLNQLSEASPTPMLQIFYSDVALMFAAVAALDEVEKDK